MTIEQIKQLNTDKFLDLYEAVMASAVVRAMENECEILDIETPEWLSRAGKKIREEVARQKHAADLTLLKDLENQNESLKTASERRADVARQIAAVQRRLGMTAGAGSRK